MKGFGFFSTAGFSFFFIKDLNVSLAGGGNYLIEGIQSTGIAFGFEPISLLSKIDSEKVKIQVISIQQDEESIKLVEKLRQNRMEENQKRKFIETKTKRNS